MTAIFADPGIYTVELRAGRADPIPDYVEIVQESRYWGMSPMQIMEMPLYWYQAGQIVRQAEERAQAIVQRRNQQR